MITRRTLPPQGSPLMLITLLITALIAVWCTILAYLDFRHNQGRNQLLEQITTSQEIAWQAARIQHHNSVQTYYDEYVMQPRTLELLRMAQDPGERDRARILLYRHLHDIYTRLRAQGLRQLQFHLPDGESLLRFHHPERFGDKLQEVRPAIRIANHELRPIFGFEAGRIVSGFRSVFPVVDPQGVHLGSVELSVPFEVIRQQMSRLLPHREFEMLLNTEAVQSILFSDQQRLYAPWDGSPRFSIEDPHRVLPDAPPMLSASAQAIVQHIANDADAQKRLAQELSTSFAVSIDGRRYTAALTAIQDTSARKTGYIASYAEAPTLLSLEAGFRINLAIASGLLLLLWIAAYRLLYENSIKLYERQRLQTINDTLGEGLYVMDSDGLITHVNQRAGELLGYAPDELLGQLAHDLFHNHEGNRQLPKERCPIFSTVQHGEEYRGEETFRTRNGQLLSVMAISRAIINKGRVTGSVTSFTDISDQKRALEQLRTLSLAVEQSPDSIVITDLQGDIRYVNEAFTHNTGYAADEVLGRNPRLLQSGHTPADTYSELWQQLTQGRIWQGELINRRKDGSEFIEQATLSPILQEDGKSIGYLAIKQDITERKQHEARIRQLAFFDPLTDLPNRAQLRERLTDLLVTEQLPYHSHILLLLNIDRFKLINDARGHRMGDKLLKAVAKRLNEHCRGAHNLVARMAADEFALLLPCDDPANNLQSQQSVADGVQATFDRPFMVGGENITLTASIGVTGFPEIGDDGPEGILRRADMALHRARASGGNQTILFETGMSEAAAQRFGIESDLRMAIDTDQLQLYLQPQVAPTGALYGAEVLIRWHHPERGLIPPSLFIPIAEQTDLIISLSQCIFKGALDILADTQHEAMPLRLSINLSPRHFRSRNFVPWLQARLNETGVDPNHLTLEITEGLFIDNLEQMAARMHELNTLGIHFSIDDFGTGYSSLAYLKRLPIWELKIDRSFVQDAPNDPGDAALVETILAVAEHMSLRVVAEGVETPAQADFLKRHAQVIHQGYLYGRPEPAQIWLQRWREHRTDISGP